MRSTGEANILDYVLIALKRKGLIAGITAAAVIAAAIAAVALPNIYRAETRIVPPQQSTSALSSYLLTQMNNPLLAAGTMAMKSPNGLYTGMLRSRVVLDRIVDRFSLVSVYKKKYREDARRRLLAAVDIQDDRKTGIIVIGVEDGDAKRSADIANAFVDELKGLTQNLAVSEASQRRLFLEEQIKKTRDTLKKSEEAMKAFMEKSGTVSLDEQAKAMIEAGSKLRAQIAAKEIQLQVVKTYATSRNPDVQLMEEELKGMRTQLSRLEASGNGISGSFMSARKLPGVGIDYAGKLREQKFNEALYELLVKHYEAARLDEARDGAVIQVLDPAVMPEKRIRPKRLLLVVVAAVTALLFSVITAFFLEYRERLSADPDNRDRMAKLKQYASFRSGE